MSDEARGRVRTEAGLKRVRAYHEGRLVADSIRPTLVWEIPYYPAYYLPAEDVKAELVATGEEQRSPSRGTGVVHDVRADGGSVAKDAALTFPESPLEQLRGLVRLDFKVFDWFEEDEPIYSHPRDPHTRVDILASSRHVRIELDGVVIAESCQPRILFETGLPPRYYLPITDWRTDLMRPTSTVTHCPYKGDAGYWSLHLGDKVYEDFVWIYRSPFPESQKIQGFAATYNERVDLYVDGVLQERPHTKF